MDNPTNCSISIWITPILDSNSPPRISPQSPPINPIHPQIHKSHSPNPKSHKDFFTSMAISTASCFFTSPSFAVNSQPPSQSISSSVRYGRARISAAYAAAAERTETETISSFRNGSPSSLYEVLGIRIGADMREVKAAYRRLARVLHPDVASRDSSADEFMKVHSAYTTLADPAKRADYDRTLFQRRAGGSSPMRSAGGYRSGRWETDQCW